jgi:hypothetical protein
MVVLYRWWGGGGCAGFFLRLLSPGCEPTSSLFTRGYHIVAPLGLFFVLLFNVKLLKSAFPASRGRLG